MPCLSGKYNPQIGPIINIKIVPAGTMNPSAPTFPHSAATFTALIDTGATSSCVSPAVAKSLGLSPIGMFPMISATHQVPVNVYLVDIVIPMVGNSFFLAGAQVMEFAPVAGCPFQTIIGRDIICRGVLTMGFDGHFSICL